MIYNWNEIYLILVHKKTDCNLTIGFFYLVEVYSMINLLVVCMFPFVIFRRYKPADVLSKDIVSEKVDGASFRVKSNEYFVPISEENIDIEAEILKLESELKRARGFLTGIQKKLLNERFVQNAPEKVIVLERKKESDTLAKINTILTSLDRLK